MKGRSRGVPRWNGDGVQEGGGKACGIEYVVERWNEGSGGCVMRWKKEGMRKCVANVLVDDMR